MDGDPLRAGLNCDQTVRRSAGQHDPVPVTELDAFPAHVHHGQPVHDDHPFIVVLEVIDRLFDGPAHDGFDRETLEPGQRLDPFTFLGWRRRRGDVPSSDHDAASLHTAVP